MGRRDEERWAARVREPEGALQGALRRLAGRVAFDARLGTYRLDGRPVRVQDLLAAAGLGG